MSNSTRPPKLSAAHLVAGLPLSDAERADLERRIAEFVESQVLRDRHRCVEQCRRRAALWRNTAAAANPVAAALEEARGRANEAQYLAELLEFGSDIPSPARRN